jgi:hypothetical protein
MVRGSESRRFTYNDDNDEDIAKRFLDWCLEMADKRYDHADQAKRNRTVVPQAHNLKYDLSGGKHLLSKFELGEKGTDVYGGTCRYKLPDSDYTGNDDLAAGMVKEGAELFLDSGPKRGRWGATMGVAAREIRVTLENARWPWSAAPYSSGAR